MGFGFSFHFGLSGGPPVVKLREKEVDKFRSNCGITKKRLLHCKSKLPTELTFEPEKAKDLKLMKFATLMISSFKSGQYPK